MREYFEHAYEGFCNTFGPFGGMLLECMIIIFVYCTLPVWIVPYALFFRKEKERGGEDAAD